MKYPFQDVLHPDWYHGHGKHSPYFEGWYYKLIDQTEGHRYAIIPGVSLNAGGDGPHTFVQILDGLSGATAYYRYPLSAFWAAQDKFEVHIGPNHFSADEIHLALEGQPLSVNGELCFRERQPWPVTLTAPGIMGWFAWIPFMECYHGVLSLDHEIHGTLDVNGHSLDFTHGRGYIEKDWGQSFPSGWVWTQTNHFSTPGSSLTASIAMIPWIGKTFRGFIVGLLHNNTLYRFATYTGAVTDHLSITPEDVSWTICDPLYRLELLAHRSEAGNLWGPSKVDMTRRVPETLKSTVRVKLTARWNDTVIFDDIGHNAGLEVAGDLEALLR